jgi:N-dimethylarginine dimethylaminohydrolase
MPQRFLMSYPEFFDVNYEINTWMDVKNKPDNFLANKQWRRLYQLLITLGANVDVVDGHKDYPDLVFTANAGTVKGKVFIPSNFKYKERQGESLIYNRWFAENGFELKSLPSEVSFEGHGDAIFFQDKLIQGHGFRSSYESHQKLSDLLETEVVPVELTNGHFYHLDTCLFVLNQATPSIIYFPGAFSPESVAVIEGLPCDKLQISEDEAHGFACNAIQVGGCVILSEGCEETAEWLMDRGIKVFFNDVSQFNLAGGGNACMVLEI